MAVLSYNYCCINIQFAPLSLPMQVSTSLLKSWTRGMPGMCVIGKLRPSLHTDIFYDHRPSTPQAPVSLHVLCKGSSSSVKMLVFQSPCHLLPHYWIEPLCMRRKGAQDQLQLAPLLAGQTTMTVVIVNFLSIHRFCISCSFM